MVTLTRTNERRVGMERLTHKARYEAGYKLNKGVKEWQAADRLGAYENTGLTPQEIMELAERDTAKAPNKKLRHRGGFETFHCPNCDTSYQMDRRYTITDEYCPKCGKLLDSSFRSFCANCGQRLEEGR